MDNNQPLKPVSADNLAVLEEAESDLKQLVIKKFLAGQSSGAFPDHLPEEKFRSGVDFIWMFLHSFLKFGDPKLMEDQLQWSTDRLPHDGMTLEEIQEYFVMIFDSIEDLLADQAWDEIEPYLQWIIARQQEIYLDANS